jgi:hypothetical protein
MFSGKDFSHLQRAKSTGGFFDRGVIGRGGGVIILANKKRLFKEHGSSRRHNKILATEANRCLTELIF